METKCDGDERRSRVRDSADVNGIDYIEVLTSLSTKVSSPDPYQALLIVRCFHPVKKLDECNIVIEGGLRIKDIGVLWARPAEEVAKVKDDMSSPIAQGLAGEERELIGGLINRERVFLVRPSSRGDFSTYVLKLVQADNSSSPLGGFDEQLSKLGFSFRVECKGDFDCAEMEKQVEQVFAKQDIDYMAKDYASFRRLMLDRLAAVMPEWKERNPADMGIMLVELLAYVGDHLSYYQDAVATEAYLGTARRRVSIRRHARLLDYHMHDGCNARAWVFLGVDRNVAESVQVPEGTKLLTITKGGSKIRRVRPENLGQEIAEGAEVFETMHEIMLYVDHNEIDFYRLDEEKRCYLPRGATTATLDDRKEKLALKAGDVLILEEVLLPKEQEGKPDAYKDIPQNGDRSHRHAVRLTNVVRRLDGLTKTHMIDVTWRREDALPFRLCIREEQGEMVRKGIARGNIVLADHGNTIFDVVDGRIVPKKEPIGTVPEKGRFRPKLPNTQPLTFAAPYQSGPASAALSCDATLAKPEIWLHGDEEKWEPARDLLSASEFTAEFVVETEDDGTAYIRFGDEETRSGRVPSNSTEGRPVKFTATYRTGNGTRGNVGAETIKGIVWPTDAIGEVRNPIEAKGGAEPEEVERVRQFAPGAFMKQERAVTEQDYEEVLGRHRDVQKARAMIRWTGSWHTVFVAIDRVDGLEVDASFEQEIRDYLERYRMAGYDIEVHGPAYVPLQISIRVNVSKGYFRENVESALARAFGRSGGFFHPDNFTFGQPIFLSQIYATAEKVEGVESVQVETFARWGKTHDRTGLESGVIGVGPYEIIRLDNDPNFPENGAIEFHMEGGI
jgi:hypothetical protein